MMPSSPSNRSNMPAVGHILQMGDGLVHGEHELRGVQLPLEHDRQQALPADRGSPRAAAMVETALLVMQLQLRHPFPRPKKGTPCDGKHESIGGQSGQPAHGFWNWATGLPGSQVAGEPTCVEMSGSSMSPEMRNPGRLSAAPRHWRAAPGPAAHAPRPPQYRQTWSGACPCPKITRQQ